MMCFREGFTYALVYDLQHGRQKRQDLFINYSKNLLERRQWLFRHYFPIFILLYFVKLIGNKKEQIDFETNK